MTTAEIILKIRKKIPLILLVSIVAGVVSYFAILHFFVSYKSQTSFYINEGVMLDMNKGSIDPQGMTVLTAMAGNRVLLLLCSDELRDSVIKQYKLYEHYGVRPGDEFAHERVLLALNRSISIRRDVTQPNLINMDVEDGDRFMAANIANGMVERVNQINREILKKDLKRRIAKYENVLSSLKEKETGSRRELLSFIDSLNPNLSRLTGEKETPSETRYKAMSMFGKVDANSAKYQSLLEEYYNISSSIGATGNDEWQTITINKKALPDIGSGQYKAFIQSFSFAFLVFSLLLGTLIYIYQNEDSMKELINSFSGKK